MNSEPHIFEIHWQGLVIEVRYCANWLECSPEIYGDALAHLEVETMHPANATLPMTETGYRSYFDSSDNIDAAGGPVDFVLTWLNHAARAPAWKARQMPWRQYYFF